MMEKSMVIFLIGILGIIIMAVIDFITRL